LKTALVVTNNFDEIKDLIKKLGELGWIIIVDEDIYQKNLADENLEPEDRIHGLTHPYAYTSLYLEPDDPLALVHWKFIDGLSTNPSELSPTIDLFFCDPQYSRNGLAIGEILMAAVDRTRVFVMTNRLELELIPWILKLPQA
jgi:hypothetical protein